MEYQKIECPRRHCPAPTRGWDVTRDLGNGLKEYRCHGCEKLFYYNVRLGRMHKWHSKYSSLKYLPIIDPYNERAIACLVALENEHRRSGIMRTDNPSEADILLVFGGDGMMLQAVHDYAQYQKPFLGLNFGKLGFFQNLPEKFSLDALVEENYEIFEAPLLEATIKTSDGEIISELALNDVTIHEDVGQSAWLELKIDDVTLVDSMEGDGIIISTPLGSTAYTKNAGGASIIPTLPAIELTPVVVDPRCSMPVVISDSCVVKIRVLQPQKREARVSQGRVFRHKGVEEVEVKLAKRHVGIAFFKDPDVFWDKFFLERLREKVYQA